MLKKISNKNKIVTRVKTFLKKGDTVTVLSGKDKGKTGLILKVDRKNNKVIVDGINQIKKAKKRTSETDAGGLITINAPINISNVIFTKDGVKSKLKYEIRDAKKVRVSRKNSEVV